MMKSEAKAEFFVSKEKRYERIIRLIGPPPIPRKEDNTPKKSPTAKEETGLFRFLVCIFAFFKV